MPVLNPNTPFQRNRLRLGATESGICTSPPLQFIQNSTLVVAPAVGESPGTLAAPPPPPRPGGVKSTAVAPSESGPTAPSVNAPRQRRRVAPLPAAIRETGAAGSVQPPNAAGSSANTAAL